MGVVDLDGSALETQAGLHGEQAEASAMRFGGEEGVEELVSDVVVDAGAVVVNLDGDRVAIIVELHLDLATLVGSVSGIEEEVDQDLSEKSGRGLKGARLQGGLKAHLDILKAAMLLQRVDDVTRSSDEVELFGRVITVGAGGAGGINEAVGQLIEAL